MSGVEVAIQALATLGAVVLGFWLRGFGQSREERRRLQTARGALAASASSSLDELKQLQEATPRPDVVRIEWTGHLDVTTWDAYKGAIYAGEDAGRAKQAHAFFEGLRTLEKDVYRYNEDFLKFKPGNRTPAGSQDLEQRMSGIRASIADLRSKAPKFD